MHLLIIIIHLFVCFSLIGIVLLQTGKGASMGAMFGGAGNQTLFGNTGASTFLGKITTVAAVVFMVTSLSLAYISKSGDKSVVEDFQPAAEESLPADQVPPAPGGEQSAPDEQAPAAPSADDNPQ
ncbi:MAG: preprotein translocase subunit SecG [Desulfosalsimonas sp.]|uniref:preprotein translocase subunit SecG n=1 Tax=Desulfosalsimonas sp. TaxID=3073848 RepID=UPI00397096FF